VERGGAGHRFVSIGPGRDNSPRARRRPLAGARDSARPRRRLSIRTLHGASSSPEGFRRPVHKRRVLDGVCVPAGFARPPGGSYWPIFRSPGVAPFSAATQSAPPSSTRRTITYAESTVSPTASPESAHRTCVPRQVVVSSERHRVRLPLFASRKSAASPSRRLPRTGSRSEPIRESLRARHALLPTLWTSDFTDISAACGMNAIGQAGIGLGDAPAGSSLSD